MPHEVIMPALGMAQDTGLIVAWLKAPGEPVAAGDALMEVETDKATMEVEAAHDGWLTDVRAGAGEAVPVGQVVALISETEAGDGAGAPPAGAAGRGPQDGPDDGSHGSDGRPDGGPGGSPAGRAGGPAAGAEGDAPPQGRALSGPPPGHTASGTPAGRDVIMPALGMAQDTGLIVAWLKAPGEAVAEGDALLEVETDKATMEVAAEAAGWLAAVLAGDGEDVPVGQVIAVISAERPDAPLVRTAAEASPQAGTATASPADVRTAPPTGAQTGEQTAPPQPAGSAGPAPAAHVAQAAPATPAAPGPRAAGAVTTPVAPGASGAPAPQAGQAALASAIGNRVLASPLARRLAAERGLELGRLAAAGIAQPYHAADLERPELLARPAAADAAPLAAMAAVVPLRLEAEIPAGALDDFLAWLAAEGPGAAADLLPALAAGALREAMAAPAAGTGAGTASGAGAAAAEPGSGQTAGAGRLVLRLERPGAPARLCADPDRVAGDTGADHVAGDTGADHVAGDTGADHVAGDAAAQDAAPALILRDLTASRITLARLGPDAGSGSGPGPGAAPVLGVARRGGTVLATLDFTADQIDAATALSLLTGFAARIEDPLRQLL